MTLTKIAPTNCFLFLSIFFRSDLITQDKLQSFISSWDLIWPGVEAKTKTFVSYYQKEMGISENYKRLFFFSNESHSREKLLDFKDACIFFESQNSKEMKRHVNLDPGILCLEHFLLATTKPYAHRPLLARSIYAELVYLFEKGNFRPLPWAYPDYLEESVLAQFKTQRERLLFSLR